MPSYFSNMLASQRAEWKDMGAAHRVMVFLWLMTPLILLIERTPADIWMSMISFAFLVRSTVRGDWGWLRLSWVRGVLVLFAILLAVSTMSRLPVDAIFETFTWMRFPLFAVATVYWLGVNSVRLQLMLIVMLVSALIMMGILTAEMITFPDRNRLVWPYGNKVPGRFVGKAMLPLAVVITTFAMRTPQISRGLMIGLIPFALAIFTLLTGERANTAVMGMAVILAAVISRRNWGQIGIFALVGVCGSILVAWVRPNLILSLVSRTSDNFSSYFVSGYWASMRPGVIYALENPLIGIGTEMHKLLCPEFLLQQDSKWEYIFPGYSACHLHPHQYYVQLAEEGGIFALLAGIVMIILIIRACLSTGNDARTPTWSPLAHGMWIIPVVTFFPQHGYNFFGQWQSIFNWFPLAIALALAAHGRKGYLQKNDD